MGSADAEFMEREKGSITVGKLADMAAFSDDLTAVPHEKIKNITVEMTIVGGRVVYKRSKGR
jgi:predicted amidohydrolase YtcJ